MSIYDERPIGDIYVEWANTLDSAGQNSVPARSRLCTHETLARVNMMMEAVISAGMLADHVKKFVFYGKNDVIDQVPDTYPIPYGKLGHAKDAFDDHDTVRIFHGILGLVTEAAEMMEMLQAHIFNFAALNMQNLLEECGDQTWYLALLAKSLDLATFNEFFATNKAKLTERYGQQWNQDGALNRDTEAEMKALDSAKDLSDPNRRVFPNATAGSFTITNGTHSATLTYDATIGDVRKVLASYGVKFQDDMEGWETILNHIRQDAASTSSPGPNLPLDSAKDPVAWAAVAEKYLGDDIIRYAVRVERGAESSLHEIWDSNSNSAMQRGQGLHIGQHGFGVKGEALTVNCMEMTPDKELTDYEEALKTAVVTETGSPVHKSQRPISDTGTCPECHHGWHCDPNVHCEDPACECKFSTLKAKRD